MQPQQQQATAVTTDPAVQPMYVVQPYNQTANTVSSYKHVQSTIVGIALISTGYLTILFNIVELVVVSAAHELAIWTASYVCCGTMVSILFHFKIIY